MGPITRDHAFASLDQLLRAGARRPAHDAPPPSGRECLLVFGVALLAYALASALRPVMLNADYLFLASVARNGTFLRPHLDAHTLGLYPAGYFRLLSLVFALAPNELLAGKLVSVLGAAASTTLTYLLAHRLFADRLLARLSAIFLLLHPSVWFWAAEPAMDWPWLACTLAALLFLLWQPARAAHWLLSGALAGLAWQFRYTTQFLWPVVIVVAFWRYRLKHPAAWLALGLWIGAFILLASPQLSLSQSLLGGPFKNAQGMNVLFYARYFGPDVSAATWLRHWPEIPPGLSTLEAIRTAPGEVAANFARNLARFAREPWVLPLPLSLLLMLGALRLARRHAAATLCLLLPAACYLAGIALVLAASRFLLPLIFLLAPVAMAALLPSRGSTPRRWHYLVPTALSLGLLLLWTPDSTPAQRARERAIPQVAQSLAAHAIASPLQVVSTDPGVYMLSGGRLEAYRSPLALDGVLPSSPEQAAAWLRERGVHYIFVESLAAPDLAPGLAPLARGPATEGLTLLQRFPPPFEAALYQVK